jgi:Protein of unknown function (DUF3891)
VLKTQVHDQIWLVQQPHHAQVSGYLAAHWGGANGFAQPGHYPGASHPDRWREEVILGIAEHDNGWWEWEAMPRISARDGLPVGVGEVATPSPANEFDQWRSGGFDRWRLGIDRLAGPHPYAALLISLHAYWLYAVAFDDLLPEEGDSRRHFVFGAPDIASNLVGDEQTTRAFLTEQAALQTELKSRLAREAQMAGAHEPQHLNPHLRLLQLFDSMSLYLALNDQADHELREVPRQSWSDRDSITWRRRDAKTIALDPYPFALDPLPVPLPARILPTDRPVDASGEPAPFTALHSVRLETLEFQLVSG